MCLFCVYTQTKRLRMLQTWICKVWIWYLKSTLWRRMFVFDDEKIKSNTSAQAAVQLIGCFCDNVIISQSTKYLHLPCSLYLMSADDQMNTGSCMLSLTVCLISPAAVSNQCVLVLIAPRLSGWWPPTWFITAIVLQLKLLPNPQTRPCTRSWPPLKTDRVSPSSVASSQMMLKLTSVSGQTANGLSVFCWFTVGLQRSRSWCCRVEWARPSRPPSSSTPTSWRGTQTFSSCSSKWKMFL